MRRDPVLKESRDGGIDRFASEHAKDIRMVQERMTKEVGMAIRKEDGVLADEIGDHAFEEFSKVFESYVIVTSGR